MPDKNSLIEKAALLAEIATDLLLAAVVMRAREQGKTVAELMKAASDKWDEGERELDRIGHLGHDE